MGRQQSATALGAAVTHLISADYHAKLTQSVADALSSENFEERCVGPAKRLSLTTKCIQLIVIAPPINSTHQVCVGFFIVNVGQIGSPRLARSHIRAAQNRCLMAKNGGNISRAYFLHQTCIMKLRYKIDKKGFFGCAAIEILTQHYNSS